MDDLNQHECMAVLLALINHMRSNNIYSVPKESSSTTELPTWMTYLQKKMTIKETNINIKLFIAKLIINEPKVRPHVCFIKLWSFNVKPRPSFISFFYLAFTSDHAEKTVPKSSHAIETALLLNPFFPSPNIRNKTLV